MKYRNTKNGYGFVARLIHWVMAFAIFAMFALGYWMMTLTYVSPYYKTAPDLHRSIGLVLLTLLLVRFVWKLLNPTPSTSDLSELEHKGSAVVHWLFYALLLAVMVAGYLISTADGRAISVFGLFDVPSLYAQKGLEKTAGKLHWILAYLTIALAALHAGAALWHHFVKKDNVLMRMLKDET